jgi:hypothetical protein
MSAKGTIELDGDDYIVVSGKDRVRCHNLDVLSAVLRSFEWTEDEIAMQIWIFRGALLNPSPR